MIMSKWINDLMFCGESKIHDLLLEIYSNELTSVLLIMGKGFDPRMNNMLNLLLGVNANISISCVLVDYPAGHTTEGDSLYQHNSSALDQLINDYKLSVHTITVDAELKWQRKIRKMCVELSKFRMTDYSSIFIDISSMPRSIYFNIVKVVDKLVDDSVNVFVAVSENVEMDSRIIKINEPRQDEICPLFGFEGGYNLEAHFDNKKIFIPILGEKQVDCLLQIYQSYIPEDVCPILPFPSEDPRRSDSLLMEYQSILYDRIQIKPQDIMYADEKNPFELYRILNTMISNYERTLKPISSDICFGVAILTSKLQSIGALLVGLENNRVAIFDAMSSDYTIDGADTINQLNTKSVPYLLWIKGEPYNE